MIHTLTREEFEEWLLVGDKKHPRTARMAGRAQKFIGGMTDRARTAFLEAALDFAWINRLAYNPQYERPEMFWTRALRAAALTRDRWLVSVATLPGVYEKRWVLGRMLGE
jgi:hypothetical protein